MLANTHRFHGHGSLRYVYRNGRACRSRLFTVKFSANPRRRHSRVAVVISKKVHKSAVGRNRARRRLYEIVRSELPAFRAPHDIAIIVSSSEVITAPHDTLALQLRELFEQARLYTD